jgi:endonuclease-3
VLRLLDIVTDADVQGKSVPGLERAIPKSKGAEFGYMLHELGADFSANAYSPTVRDLLLQVNPECEGRLPKRRAARKVQEPPAAPAEKSAKASKSKTEESPAAAKPAKRKKESHAEPPQAEPAKKKPTAAPQKPAKAAKKKPSASEGLSKRKPR